MDGLAQYNVSLASTSPFFIYSPNRDGDVSLTWNSSYTESPIWPSAGNRRVPQGSPYRRTWATPGASVEFDYLGTDIYLCFNSGGSNIYILTIDGTEITDTDAGPDPVCADYPDDTMLFRSSGIPMGNHKATLKVDASQSHEFQFFGGIITMGVTSGRYCNSSSCPYNNLISSPSRDVTVSSHVPAKQVDDLDDGWNMVPGRQVEGSDWQSGPAPASSSLIADGYSWTCTYDAQNPRSASYAFSGAGGVILRGTISEGLQFFSVDFDGQHFPLDATSFWPDRTSAVLFMRGGLDPKKNYTIKLSNYNERYKTCDKLPSTQPFRLCCMGLDGLVLLGDGGPPSPTQPSAEKQRPTRKSSTQRSHVGSTVGALVGAGAAIAVVTAVVALYFRRKKRHSHGAVINFLTIASRPQIPAVGPHPPGDTSALLRRKLDSLGKGNGPARPASTHTAGFSPAALVDSMDHSRAHPDPALGSLVSPEIRDEIVLLVEERMNAHAQALYGSQPGETTMPPAYHG